MMGASSAAPSRSSTAAGPASCARGRRRSPLRRPPPPRSIRRPRRPRRCGWRVAARLALERVDVVQAPHFRQRRQRHRFGRPQHQALAVVPEQQRIRLGEGVGQGARRAPMAVASATAPCRRRPAAAAGAGGGRQRRQHRRILQRNQQAGRRLRLALARADQVVAVQRDAGWPLAASRMMVGAGTPSGWCGSSRASRCGTARPAPGCRPAAAPLALRVLEGPRSGRRARGWSRRRPPRSTRSNAWWWRGRRCWCRPRWFPSPPTAPGRSSCAPCRPRRSAGGCAA